MGAAAALGALLTQAESGYEAVWAQSGVDIDQPMGAYAVPNIDGQAARPFAVRRGQGHLFLMRTDAAVVKERMMSLGYFLPVDGSKDGEVRAKSFPELTLRNATCWAPEVTKGLAYVQKAQPEGTYRGLFWLFVAAEKNKRRKAQQAELNKPAPKTE